MKKGNLTLEDFAGLTQRIKAQSLKKGDGPVLEAMIQKTLLIQQKYREGKITSRKQLRRLMAIARPEESDD